MAQYAILIYAHDSAHHPDATPEDTATCDAHADEMTSSGSLVMAYALTPRDMATSIRADAVTDGKARLLGPACHHDSDDLVPWRDRIVDIRQLAIDEVQIRAAHAAGLDPDQELPGSRGRQPQLGERERCTVREQPHGVHGSLTPRAWRAVALRQRPGAPPPRR